ncbi:hypothetical protein BpHYR1_002053 [Brachionus plicatilis]|uniref:Uncharacterized protein n=1 Tax=Brachionus plicatilis TaxID=10195 RepID=A0A3M7PZY9_BRAPC|nr:hypothetical protein BpHYR1_002053 [Brachionus plicatilis]
MDVQPLHPCAKFTFQWTDNGPQVICIILLVRNAGDHDVVLSNKNITLEKFLNIWETLKSESVDWFLNSTTFASISLPIDHLIFQTYLAGQPGLYLFFYP